MGSVPKTSVRWFSVEGKRELFNNTVVEAGKAGRPTRKYVIVERGTYEKTSTLTIINVKSDDSGHYKCITRNQAGAEEGNFTLQVLTLEIDHILRFTKVGTLYQNR